MNFGLVEALEKTLAPATKQLIDALSHIQSQLKEVAAGQRRTNELLTELLRRQPQTTPRPRQTGEKK